MAINQELLQAVSFNPTKETYTASVLDLCKDIEAKKIVLPLYQTGIRWIDSKFIDLLNFQLLGKAPVSPISMNLIEDSSIAVAQVAFINRETIEENVQNKKSVTDGQQRLSCNFYAYSDNSKFENFVLDLAKGKFIIIDDGAIKRHQVPVGKLLNKDISELNKYKNSVSYLKKDEITDLLYAVRSKMFSYSYTINTAKNLTESEQIEWFEVLNNAGSKVSALQMKFTKFLVNGLDIHKVYLDIFEDKINQAGMEDAFVHFETKVSFPISALNPGYEIVKNKEHISNFSPFPSETKENQLCALSVDELMQCINLTLTALDKTIIFIRANDLPTPKRMDYITYIAGLFVYLGDQEPSDAQKSEIIKWYNKTKFTNMTNPDRRNCFDKLLEIRFTK
jgi:hypothetical protein